MGISIACMLHSIKSLKFELLIIESAHLVSDDLRNLVHRMIGFIVMTVVWILFTILLQFFWSVSHAAWEKSSQVWVECIQDIMNVQNISEYSDWIGDQCIDDSSGRHVFPSAIYFVTFPIANLIRYAFKYYFVVQLLMFLMLFSFCFSMF